MVWIWRSLHSANLKHVSEWHRDKMLFCNWNLEKKKKKKRKQNRLPYDHFWSKFDQNNHSHQRMNTAMHWAMHLYNSTAWRTNLLSTSCSPMTKECNWLIICQLCPFVTGGQHVYTFQVQALSSRFIIPNNTGQIQWVEAKSLIPLSYRGGFYLGVYINRSINYCNKVT